MPFIELQAVDVAGAAALAPELAAAVASALGLGPSDVLVSVVAAAGVYDGGGPVGGGAWPSAILHGRRRGGEEMEAARAAAAVVLARGLATAPERVWVQWCTG
ncbi:MAG: hypothetical protein ACYDEN_02390 [Acidimicrobiales bacterium]